MLTFCFKFLAKLASHFKVDQYLNLEGGRYIIIKRSNLVICLGSTWIALVWKKCDFFFLSFVKVKLFVREDVGETQGEKVKNFPNFKAIK